MGTFNVKTTAYFLTVTALLSAILTYMSTVSMGFPDGHLTEFERAVKPLFIRYSVFAILFGILFYMVARFSVKTLSRFVFYFSLVFFILAIIGVIFLYVYAHSNLNHGGGG